MLKKEFDIRMASAEKNYLDNIQKDLTKQRYAMEMCNCHNVDALWMFALNSYNPLSPSNTLTEAQVQCLFCRMGAELTDESIVVPDIEEPPIPTFQAQWGWFATNPYNAIFEGGDPLTYQGSGSFFEGADIFADYRSAPSNQYLVLRYPLTEIVKTQWYNDVFNYGAVPDSNFLSPISANGFRYIISRVGLTLNPAQLTKFY
jgi:hypothetical protein